MRLLQVLGPAHYFEFEDIEKNVLETSSKIFESIQRLTNWNGENITGVFECEKL